MYLVASAATLIYYHICQILSTTFLTFFEKFSLQQIFRSSVLIALAISSVIVPNVSADVNTFFQFFSFFLYFLFHGKTWAKRQLLHGAAFWCLFKNMYSSSVSGSSQWHFVYPVHMPYRYTASALSTRTLPVG